MAANPFSAIRVGGQYQTHHRIQLLVDTYETGGLERGTTALLLSFFGVDLGCE